MQFCRADACQERPELVDRDFRVLIVDYNDPATLQHALLGVDIVISTVTGDPQINLIHSAVAARVSRFAPAEFGATLNLETAGDDPLDRGRALALSWLNHYKTTYGTEFCAFICGILYERFDQGGLRRHALGSQTEGSDEGDYLINIRHLTVEAPFRNNDDEEIHVCLTAIRDVAAFVVQALGMREWPTMLTMYSERLTVGQIVRRVQDCRGMLYNTHTISDGALPYADRWQTIGAQLQVRTEYDMETLAHEIQFATMNNNQSRRQRAIVHLATAAGRFDFTEPTLNQRFRNVPRLRFRDWLNQSWT